MKSAEIRDAFLRYFESQGHTAVASSSLVPGNDPTLLFTNAGMVQFKDVFLGGDKRPYVRATSSQRCVRAGGKHNDLENVGYTARHHTFFEMLGNFSFGDYFKREAIQFAWQFLTEVLRLPPEKLWVTVHISDDEAADIWIKEVGVSPQRFSRLDEDNFWQMGDTGPCGPSSEIFYDHGEHVPGGPPGSPDDNLDRYIEIWNLVFMQFERQVSGELVPLPKPSVDTGMGLERIAAVMQGVHSNYEIDLFQALLNAAAAATGCQDLSHKSLRVIADHIRSCAFLVADGVLPSNEGRGYVLRRIMRRAIRHGHKLGQEQHFFHKLVGALVEQMGDAYPELKVKQAQIEKVLLAEEDQFAKTLDKGIGVLDAKLSDLKGKQIPADVVFTLYDTYGFPVDLTNDIARERGLTLDLPGYEKLMAKQRQQSRDAGKFSVDYTAGITLEGASEFTGYEQLAQQSVISQMVSNSLVKNLQEGEQGVIVLGSTPFYAESGGQAGDCGFIESGSSRFEVTDCRKEGANHLHFGRVVQGSFAVGETVSARVDATVRQNTALNHSATHLLHAALRKVLGEHVTQKGSLVDSARLRFDFSHFEAVTPKQLQEIEDLVNSEVRRNSAIQTELCDMEQAKTKGAMALFGEKYGDTVRVLTMGDGFSVELCGGTHAQRTGDIGIFKIISESGIASGIRRIEAVTGEIAFRALVDAQNALFAVAGLLKASPDLVVEKLESLLQDYKQLEKSLAAAKTQLASASVDDWLSEAVLVNDVKILIKIIRNTNDAKVLRDLMDKLKDKLGNAAVLLAGTDNETVSLVAGVSKDAIGRFKAGDMVRFVAEKIGAKGGGRPDMAQGGGRDNGSLDQAVAELISSLTT